MKNFTKKGYFTLEAAIFLPIFILAILTIGYVVRVIGTAENISYISVDEAELLAAKAYGKKIAFEFPKNLQERIKKENADIKEVTIEDFYYLCQTSEQSGKIAFRVKAKVGIPLPIYSDKSIFYETRIKCRGFIGSRNKSPVVSFDEMEKEQLSDIVYIFPMSGQRYHKENCSFVKANPRRTILNRLIKSQYSPCSLCKPDNIATGSIVYCFTKAGNVFHIGTCKTIDKYTVEIEKEEAVKRGYTPCLKCGGG